MIARLVSGLAKLGLLVATLVASILVSAPHAEAQGEKYTAKEMRQRFYHKDNYTVADLLWCLRAKRMVYCTIFIQGVADAARLDGFRHKGKRMCWPKGDPVPLSQVVSIVMKEKRLLKWPPRDPAAAFILSALAEACTFEK